MKKLMMIGCCLAGTLAFTSCGSGEGNTEATNQTGTPTVAGVDSTITDENKELLAFAARNNMLQIELGRMATTKGNSENARTYGQQLTDWYTTKQQELQELAQQYGVNVPQQLESDQQEHLEEARNADANEFDKEYWESVTKAQQDAIDQFESNLNDVEEADATAFTLWARNTSKELRAQMEQAKAYQLEHNNNNSI
ncbi:DUF4142 domain-containing protein [Pontibacter rugosus]|uniref:DUF4142 domain-containing protein n=1 Tax=Pontibacter rugosus TaxID=1745966 RepID=A0ABW3SW37_9BACT